MRSDRYRSFEELAAHERDGLDFQIRVHRRDSPVAIIAPHGGKIEPGTSETGEAIAGEFFSFYAFEGIKRGHNHDLHITSTRFDEPDCIALIKTARVVVAVHGLSDLQHDFVCVGGAHVDLRDQLIEALSLAGFDARLDTDPAHAGASTANICNHSGPGVQLEISRGLRERLKDTSPELDEFAGAVRTVLLRFAASL